eukprot:m.298375 g.298375  ORF g.298375 m.298375 type:complete len:206 (-) comp13854_c0_seq1:144-761(-)
MPRKGMSLEEKRTKMLEWFGQTEDVYQHKEVEKQCPKDTGIVAGAIKDVLQGLIDDSLVHCEKIGTSNYYWAFPSETGQTKKRKLRDLEEEVEELSNKKIALESKLAEMQDATDDPEECAALAAKHDELKTENERLKKQVAQVMSCDPDVLRDKKRKAKVALEAANRWTDNVFTIKSFCQRKFGVDEATVNRQLGIKSDFDYIEA